MMSAVGQIEKKTPARIVVLFRERVHYDYLGSRIDRDNRNFDLDLLRGCHRSSRWWIWRIERLSCLAKRW